jgi:SAM-dependent methyltransferase
VNELENFDPDWLALREPVDHATRSERLETALFDGLRGRSRVRVVDLGAGSGSTLRHLAPRLAGRGLEQEWVLVDHDAELLERALRSEVPATVTTARVDLADRAALRDVLAGADVVVGSALLDVLPAAVATGLVEELSDLEPRPAVLFVLTVSGGASVDPPAPGVAEAFDADQRSHGLGPDATGFVAAAFAERGWTVQRTPTPWRLTDSPLLHAWARGWFTAAGAPVAEVSAAVVPHEDLLAQ